MGYSKDPFGMNKRANKTLNTIIKVGTKTSKNIKRYSKQKSKSNINPTTINNGGCAGSIIILIIISATITVLI